MVGKGKEWEKEVSPLRFQMIQNIVPLVSWLASECVGLWRGGAASGPWLSKPC